MYHIIKSEINHSEFYFSPNDERINVQPLASWDKYQKNKRKIGAWFWMSARPLYSLLLAKSLLLLPLTMDCIKCMQLLLLEASLHKLLHLQHLLKGTQHQHYPQFQLDLCLLAFSLSLMVLVSKIVYCSPGFLFSHSLGSHFFSCFTSVLSG